MYFFVRTLATTDIPVSYTHLDVYKRQDHGRYLIIDMFTHNICCSFLLPFADILDNCRMFCNELWICFFTLQIFHTITVHLLTQVIQKQNQFLLIRCHVNDIMKTYIGFRNLCDILAFRCV